MWLILVRVESILELETALGAELLRASLLGATRPRIADRYTIERFLGRGATGLVVAARDERLGRDVALKLAIAGADEEALHEARALAGLDHPNVVRVFDAEHVETLLDGIPVRLRVVVMQLVKGRSLRVWLREQPRTAEEILEVFRYAGAGLAAAHAQRIVHRDFKPDNVIMGEDGKVRIIDFGFAAADRSSQVNARAAAMDVAGTDPYLAPEARVGRATSKSDQYAFAISVMESLGADPGNTGGQPPPGVDMRVWGVLQRGSAAEPGERYQDVQALLDALRPPGTSTRRRAVIGALVVSILGLVVALGSRMGPGGAEPSAASGKGCASLPDTWAFRTRFSDNDWGIYQVERTGGVGCELQVEIERLCDSGQPKGYRPGFFLGSWAGRAEPVTGGGVAIRMNDVRIRNRKNPEKYGEYDFHITYDAGDLRGKAIRTKPYAPPGEGSIEPASRSACSGGHVEHKP